jgi:hypothetical protein
VQFTSGSEQFLVSSLLFDFRFRLILDLIFDATVFQVPKICFSRKDFSSAPVFLLFRDCVAHRPPDLVRHLFSARERRRCRFPQVPARSAQRNPFPLPRQGARSIHVSRLARRRFPPEQKCSRFFVLLLQADFCFLHLLSVSARVVSSGRVSRPRDQIVPAEDFRLPPEKIRRPRELQVSAFRLHPGISFSRRDFAAQGRAPSRCFWSFRFHFLDRDSCCRKLLRVLLIFWFAHPGLQFSHPCRFERIFLCLAWEPESAVKASILQLRLLFRVEAGFLFLRVIEFKT